MMLVKISILLDWIILTSKISYRTKKRLVNWWWTIFCSVLYDIDGMNELHDTQMKPYVDPAKYLLEQNMAIAHVNKCELSTKLYWTKRATQPYEIVNQLHAGRY